MTEGQGDFKPPLPSPDRKPAHIDPEKKLSYDTPNKNAVLEQLRQQVAKSQAPNFQNLGDLIAAELTDAREAATFQGNLARDLGDLMGDEDKEGNDALEKALEKEIARLASLEKTAEILISSPGALKTSHQLDLSHYLDANIQEVWGSTMPKIDKAQAIGALNWLNDKVRAINEEK